VRRALAALLQAVAVVLLVACGPQPAATPGADSPIDGIVVAVDAASLTDVRSFTLRTSGGLSFDFNLGSLENATEFSPSHLKEHQATSAAIRVWFRLEGGARVAYRIEDAHDAPGTT